MKLGKKLKKYNIGGWAALAQAGTDISTSVKGDGSSTTANQAGTLIDPWNQFKDNDNAGDWALSFLNPLGSALLKGQKQTDAYNEEKRLRDEALSRTSLLNSNARLQNYDSLGSNLNNIYAQYGGKLNPPSKYLIKSDYISNKKVLPFNTNQEYSVIDDIIYYPKKVIDAAIPSMGELSGKVDSYLLNKKNREYKESEESALANLMKDKNLRNQLSVKATGGYLKPMSNNNMEVVGNSHENGGVKLGSNVEVEGKETINTSDENPYVFSEVLGFADKHKRLAKQMSKVEKRPYNAISANTLSLLKQKEEKLKMDQEQIRSLLGSNVNI